MAALPCLFHFLCEGAVRPGEHLFPAALGGRRKSGKLLCDRCQHKFSVELDQVLPEQLRFFNTSLGVVGDHNEVPAMTPMHDQVSGRDLFLDESFNIHSRVPIIEDLGVDAAGKEQKRFSVIGERAHQHMLDTLRKQGKRFDVERVVATRFLQSEEVRNQFGMGGSNGFRAVARIALNMLAHADPITARDSGLEPFKRWIFDDIETKQFCHFAHPLPPQLCPPSSFEFGHRIALGFGDGGQVFARVSFFDAFEFALRLGCRRGAGLRLLILDINPLSPHAAQRVDMDQVELAASAEEIQELGRIFDDQDAVADRAEARGRHIIECGLHRALLDLVKGPVADVNVARALPGEVRPVAYRKALEPLLQVGLNRWLEANPLVANHFEAKNCAPLAAAIRAMVGVPEHEHRGAELVLDHLAEVLGAVLEHRAISNEDARWLLSGDRALTLAMRAVLVQLERRAGATP